MSNENKKPRVQVFGRHSAKIARDKDKRAFVVPFPTGADPMDPRRLQHAIPFEIAALCCGKDAWMSKVTAKCPDCNGFFTAKEFGGLTVCPACADKCR